VTWTGKFSSKKRQTTLTDGYIIQNVWEYSPPGESNGNIGRL